MIGPTLGFMLSSACLSLYENPFLDPGFSSKEPQWIGCWWLGFVVLGTCLMLVSLPLALFPKQIRKENACTKPLPLPSREHHIFHDMFISLKKLLGNAILTFHMLSIVFQINGIYAYQVFMAKYMENQYGQTASVASLFSGITKLSTLIIGTFLGSFLIQIFKPHPRNLTIYMMLVSMFSVTFMFSAFFMGCTSPPLFGQTLSDFNPFHDCNAHCGCTFDEYAPICVNENEAFPSFCFAGCQAPSNGSEIQFQDCSCTGALSNNSVVKEGYCDVQCDLFLPYFIMLTISIVLTSTTRVGKVLITLRCGGENDKSLSLGTVEFFISVFATIPHPLLYGLVIDQSCLVWKHNCGKRGNCQKYENDQFRYNFHTLSLVFLLSCFFCEGIVSYLSKGMTQFYGPVRNRECVEDNKIENENSQL